jgi:hypothetical protein
MIEEHLSRIRSKEEEARAHSAEAAVRAAELAELERSLMAASRRSADEKIAGLRAEDAKKLAALSVLAKKNLAKAVETILKEFRQGA